MKEARLFKENTPIIVPAKEVLDGKYSRDEEFVDIEYQFKLQFVKGAKNGGGPYFRMYYSLEEYKKRFPDSADRYEIVRDMRHFQESPWHKHWKQNFSSFCKIEKSIKSNKTNEWKIADAYYEERKTCIEFQHSYISSDFEKRNQHYSDLKIKVVWLYDLSTANVKKNENGNIELLENNAKGFFKVSEVPENLSNHLVYIQVKSGTIYKVDKLLRREIPGDRKSTIRYFVPNEVYSESEFIDAIKSDKIVIPETPKSYTLQQLWNSNYLSMTVKNIYTDDIIRINRDYKNEMYRDSTGCITYVYADSKNKKEYHIKRDKENQANWILLNAHYKNK